MVGRALRRRWKGYQGRENPWNTGPQAGAWQGVPGTARRSKWGEGGKARTVGEEVRGTQGPDQGGPSRARLWFGMELGSTASFGHDVSYALKDYLGCFVENRQTWQERRPRLKAIVLMWARGSVGAPWWVRCRCWEVLDFWKYFESRDMGIAVIPRLFGWEK